MPPRCAHPATLEATRLLKPPSYGEAAGDGPLLLMTQNPAGAHLPVSQGSPSDSSMARTPPGAVRDASPLKPASTPAAGEHVQREAPAQQPGPSKPRRALLGRLPPRRC